MVLMSIAYLNKSIAIEETGDSTGDFPNAVTFCDHIKIDSV